MSSREHTHTTDILLHIPKHTTSTTLQFSTAHCYFIKYHQHTPYPLLCHPHTAPLPLPIAMSSQSTQPLTLPLVVSPQNTPMHIIHCCVPSPKPPHPKASPTFQLSTNMNQHQAKHVSQAIRTLVGTQQNITPHPKHNT